MLIQWSLASNQPQWHSSHGNPYNDASSFCYDINQTVAINIYLKNKQDIEDQQFQMALKCDLWKIFG